MFFSLQNWGKSLWPLQYVRLYKRKTLLYKTENKNKKKEEWFCITYSMYLLQM